MLYGAAIRLMLLLPSCAGGIVMAMTAAVIAVYAGDVLRVSARATLRCLLLMMLR